jgi:hypothetical protein
MFSPRTCDNFEVLAYHRNPSSFDGQSRTPERLSARLRLP